MFVIGSALKKQWQGGQAKRSRIYTQTDPRLPATILVKQRHGCLGYIGDEILPSYVEIIS